ncbi:MAG: hypothetical protein GXP54_12995 [Deltaproteobacteria bacterium]|nr:hypothetical protein [Deltaproteobacteria bacterium]
MQAQKTPVKDVVAVRIAGSPQRVWKDVIDLSRREIAEPLDLLSAIGSDGFSPAFQDMVMGLMQAPADLPEGWVVQDPARSSVRIGTWSRTLAAAVEITDDLAREVSGIWIDAGLIPPPDPVRVLILEGTADHATITCQAFLPAGPEQTDDAASLRLVQAMNPPHTLNRPIGIEGHVIDIFHPRISGTESDTSTIPASGAATWINASIPDCRLMGPLESDVASDPEACARGLGEAYLSVIRELMKGG